MVGGKVIGLARSEKGTLLHVRDWNDVCAVRVDEQGRRIAVGDEVWWQCGEVMWTPRTSKGGRRQGVDFDIVLPKIGYSHAFGHV